MKRIKFIKHVTFVLLTIFFASCSDLEIEETDSIFSEQSGDFSGVDAAGVLNTVYNDLRGQIENQADLYALLEVSTDEFLVATRGTDWGDNGVWRTLHSHTWNANHSYVNATWNNMNKNVFNTTAIIDSRSNPTSQQEGEARFLRAYSMYQIMDLFGQQPFRNVDDAIDATPMVMSRTESLNFIIDDLNQAINLLPSAPAGGSNKATKEGAQFLLAKILLNKHVYNGSGSPDNADMQQVVNLVDAIHAAGFDLQSGYFDLFTDAVDSETIYFTTSSAGNLIWNGLHYNQITPDNTGGGWNGWTTIAEFYDKFEGSANSNYIGDGQEERRGYVPKDGSHYGIGYGFLIGQQYDASGAELKDRPGNPLIFTKELPGLLGNDERTGIRVIKYHPENGAYAGHRILFRYSDAHLMKAEAMMRMGGDPTALVNELRSIRGASPLGSVGEQQLLDERGRELYAEGWRRNDLIRFGQFTNPWSYKEVDGDDTKNLYPIPTAALTTNPNLVQNPGY
ncbi:RagB/SusD family nutrient uptake outer membrane protein [Aegicerativicinus sediminis]|uniref:RagB/SusD family nutrient uptake outer membrane protein n=1 Tax=Aegicerativicinus sediminis TaxID=2893202 RepID=UPI001E544F97|nr:RagB/SusD family nutrient uptake outer membrane protein [Aegicerativicinus sediminis]